MAGSPIIEIKINGPTGLTGFPDPKPKQAVSVHSIKPVENNNALPTSHGTAEVPVIIKMAVPKTRLMVLIMNNWRGALSDLGDQYTSVDLQHKLARWWGD